MAERRMFSKTIIDSDRFLDMPPSAQLLYFHLAMRADDDGFVDKQKTIMRITGSSQADMDMLIECGFVISFESGIIAIRHWRVNNHIQKDRYKHTIHKAEREKVTLDENNVYTLDTTCIQSVSKMDTQDRPGQERLVEDSLGQDRQGQERPLLCTPEEFGFGAPCPPEEPQPEYMAECPPEEAVGSEVLSVGSEVLSEVSSVGQSSENDLISDKGLGLSYEQCGRLVEMCSEADVETYMQKLSDWQIRSGKKCRNPFNTIMSWILEDRVKLGAKKSPKKPQKSEESSSYDIEEFERYAMNLDFSKLSPANGGG